MFTLLPFWKKKRLPKHWALEICPWWCHTVVVTMLLQGRWHPLTAGGWSCWASNFSGAEIPQKCENGFETGPFIQFSHLGHLYVETLVITIETPKNKSVCVVWNEHVELPPPPFFLTQWLPSRVVQSWQAGEPRGRRPCSASQGNEIIKRTRFRCSERLLFFIFPLFGPNKKVTRRNYLKCNVIFISRKPSPSYSQWAALPLCRRRN